MEKFVQMWLESGIIDNDTAQKMRADISAEKARVQRIRLNILIYTIAAVFIGIGVITFISANDWLLALLNKIPSMKVIAIFAATAGALLGGYKLAYESNKFPKLGHALIFLSTILIGGTYALVGQTYNINAHNSSLMFLWMASILPVAYLFRNAAINIVAVILFSLGVIFYYMELALDFGLTWTIFIPVFIGAILYTVGNIPQIVEKYNDFSLTYKLVGLAPMFVTLLILTCSVEKSYQLNSPHYVIPLIFLIAVNLISFLWIKSDNNLIKIETTFIVSFLIGLITMLLVPHVSIPAVIVLANIAIITIISAGFNYGYKFENSRIIGLTNWFLITYLALNYCRWGWNYMEKATFFIVGGLCLLALGMFLEKNRKKITKKDN